MAGITDWLRAIGLEKHASVFVENEITPDILPHLTEDDVRSLGLPLGPRRMVMVAIRELRAEVDAAADGPPPAPGGGEAERRQLTVMFCDLVGSTKLSLVLDPEELLELMQGYRAASAGVIERYDGHIAQYLGDGLLIYFGWPTAHEDDGERAVRTALELRDAVRALPADPPLEVRIGLATGPVVVGDRAGDDVADARLAIGETPNLAARLQGLADPGEIILAPATRRLVQDLFEFTELDAAELKGFGRPVRPWRVEGERQGAVRFRTVGSGEAGPLVGRQAERRLLLDRWGEAHSGRGQVVLLGGEAGIGKSRLAQWLLANVPGPRVTHHYHCSPFHVNVRLHPFAQWLEHESGFTRDDSPDTRLEKFEALLRSLDRLASAPLLAAVLGLPTDRYPPLDVSPQKQRDLTLEAMVELVEASARDAPLLMVFEDLHWVDPTSHELLELLAQRIRDRSILMVLTHRPEYAPSETHWPGATHIRLSRMDRVMGARLVRSVTDGLPLPPDVEDEILDRTDGIPLFIEEVTRAVLESGLLVVRDGEYVLEGSLVELAIPTSLRDSLMARLDRLGEAKLVAQIGACIGREFSHDLIGNVWEAGTESLDTLLLRLTESGLVTVRGAPPHERFQFKHALIQDAAHESLLKSRRSALHGRIAEVLEAEYGVGADHKPERLAYHHTQAGHTVEAIPLWRLAGSLAVERVALKEAEGYLRTGLSLIDDLPRSEERDRLELSIREPLNAVWTGLRGWAAPEVGANAAAILALAESQGERRSLLLALWWVWTSTITQGRIADSGPWARRLLEAGERTDDLDLRMFGNAAVMVQEFLGARLEKSRSHADRVVELYDHDRAEVWLQLTGHDPRTFVQVYHCQLLWMLGHPDRAVALSDESVELARADNHAFGLAWALTFSAYVFAYRREPARLLHRLEEADRVAREQGISFISDVSVPQAQGIALMQQGHVREAVPVLRKGIREWTRVGGHVRVPFLRAMLAVAVSGTGDSAEAMALVDQSLDQIESAGGQERLWRPEVLRIRGGILARQGRTDEAEAQFRTALDDARGAGARSWELRSALSLARLLDGEGRREEARETLGSPYEWFEEGLETPDLAEARELLRRLES